MHRGRDPASQSGELAAIYDSERKRGRNSGRTSKDLIGLFQAKEKQLTIRALVTGTQSLRGARSAPPPKSNSKENSENSLSGLAGGHLGR
jgi:hypothetical protein